MIIRDTTREDRKFFYPHIDDIREVIAAGVTQMFPDELDGMKSVDNKGHVMAIGGNMGDRVWFVTSGKVDFMSRNDKLRFRKCIIEYRDKMLETYPVLWNYVWIGNESHIRFLKTIGAVFHNEFTLGGQFQLFTIRR